MRLWATFESPLQKLAELVELRLLQVEDGAAGRRQGWRMCGNDAAVGWAAETGRTLHITFHSDDRFNQRDASQPDIGAWIRFARKYTVKQMYTVIWQKAASPSCHQSTDSRGGERIRQILTPSNTWFLGSTWVSPQTASRLVQTFLHSLLVCQIHRQTDTHTHHATCDIYSNRPHLYTPHAYDEA